MLTISWKMMENDGASLSANLSVRIELVSEAWEACFIALIQQLSGNQRTSIETPDSNNPLVEN
jgi:hypothetical protein